MKKIKINSELAFFIGILLLSIGVTFIIKSDFGISVVQASAFVIYTFFPKITFGTYNYLIQLVLIVILILIIRKFKFRFMFSFLSAIFYGYTIDLVMFLMRNLSATTLTMRILFFAIGFILVVHAVILFFRTNVPLMPYDIFVTDLAKHKGWNTGTVKILFDFSALTLSIILSFIFFQNLVGIGIGTIISGLFTGICVKYMGKLIDKVIVFTPFFKGNKC